MKCLNCSKDIIISRNILNLFSLKEQYVCTKCLNTINISPNYTLLPVDNKLILIHYLLFDNDININLACLYKEFAILYKKLIQYNQLLLVFNTYYLTENSYFYLNELAKHHQGKFSILCYKMC